MPANARQATRRTDPQATRLCQPPDAQEQAVSFCAW